MRIIWDWYCNLSNRCKTSIHSLFAVLALTSTVMSVTGIAIYDWTHHFWVSLLIVVGFAIVVYLCAYCAIGCIYKDSVTLKIRKTPITVTVCCNDIFKTEGWKVIGCDTHYDTRVDDIVISKRSLHGQFVLGHGDIEEIKIAVRNEAEKLGKMPDENGLFEFPLGTIIPYHSSVDGQTYLLLAMTRLNSNHESHINMAEFEHMLMKMWNEIDRVYASNNIVLPLLGSGISRFDDGPKEDAALLKCMLCTLNTSGVSLNSEVTIVLYNEAKDIPLYEYREMFKSI